MAVYRYSALTSAGKKITGCFEGESLVHLKKMLKGQGLILTACHEKQGGGPRSLLPQKERLPFALHISQLLSAGVPLFEALQLLKPQQHSLKMKEMIDNCLARLKEGASFSAAISQYKDFFDERFVAIIESGEQSGDLPAAFHVLVKALERQEARRKKLFALLFYPALLLSFSLVVMLAVLLFVIPSLEELFGDLSGSGFTGLVFEASHFLCHYGFYFLGALGLSVGGFMIYRQKAFRLCEGLALRIGFVQKLVMENSLAELSLTLSMLLGAGVPLLEALKICERKTALHTLRTVLQAATMDIQTGLSFSQSLSKSSQLPPLFVKMIAASEDSGSLQEATAKLAHYFEDSSQHKLQQLMTWLQPVILLLMGAFIAAVMLAVLLPLSDPQLLLRG